VFIRLQKITRQRFKFESARHVTGSLASCCQSANLDG
jgi:hypothetical protein